MNHADQDVLRRYLLGAAGPGLAEDIEQRLFSEDRVFWERVSMAEDELVDDYAAGGLDADDRHAFESRFLVTDERRAKLEFALALQACARVERTPPRAAWAWLRAPSAVPRWAFAAAALLVVALLPALLWRAAPESGPQAALSVSLAPGLLRGAGVGIVRVNLPRGCEVVHLDLLTGADAYATYSATVHEVSGEPIWSQHKLSGAARDGGITVRLTLPCSILPEDDYWVRLAGAAPGQELSQLDRYDFRVLRD
jgi:hypothetical protein